MITKLKHLDLFTVGIQLIISAIEIGLGINLAFVTHALVEPVFPEYPWAANAASITVGLFIGLGASALFSKKEDAIEAITIYAIEKGQDPVWRLLALWAVLLAFIGLDISGLLYRLQFLNSRGASWLIAVGCFLAVLPLLLGMILHPMKHKPVNLIKSEITERFDRDHVTEMYQSLGKMPLKIRQLAYNGNVEEALREANKYLAEQDELKRNKRLYIHRRNNSAPAIAAAPEVQQIEGPKTDELAQEGEIQEAPEPVNFQKARR